jgi:hypothetical protein
MSNKEALQMAVNHALSERKACLERQMLAGIDNKRPGAWKEYGYKDNLTFADFYQLYKRGGLAHGAVHLLYEKCWETLPWVIEGTEYDNKRPWTQWEKRVRMQFAGLNVWQAAREADRMRLVGRYAGLLIQAADGKSWDVELTKNTRIVKLIPAWEGQLKPASWDTNEQSATYGEVLTWTYHEANVMETNDGTPGRAVTVHHSRVVIFGCHRTGSSFLEAAFNDCVNIEKIMGGSGESFLKNASRQIHLGFDKDVNLEDIARSYGVPIGELQEVFNQTARDLNMGIDTILATQGATASPLVANVPDPAPHFEISLQSAACSWRIPTKILVGMQTGERASTQDEKAFNRRGQGRRINELNTDLTRMVRHFIRYGLIPRLSGGEFTIMWDDLSESTQAEKVELALKMAEVNAKQVGVEAIFDKNEIREAAGFDPDLDDEPLPDDEDA